MSNKNKWIRKNIQFRDKLFEIKNELGRIWEYDGYHVRSKVLHVLDMGPKTLWINRMYKDLIEYEQ